VICWPSRWIERARIVGGIESVRRRLIFESPAKHAAAPP
jgi:hypothetical protein